MWNPICRVFLGHFFRKHSPFRLSFVRHALQSGSVNETPQNSKNGSPSRKPVILDCNVKRAVQHDSSGPCTEAIDHTCQKEK